jgi:protein-tyrosine phosphatase
VVDIHCHILPNLDDGPDTLDESLAMAEMAIEDGITHVVATPHACNEFVFDYRRVRNAREQLQAKVGARLTLATGCDFHLNPENLRALKEDAPRFCINQRGYLLIEFDESAIPPSMDQTLHELQLAGLRPVITHPERNSVLHANPERLGAWVRRGCFVQITAGSLTGTFGKRARQDATRWLEQELVHFVASDAHNLGRRPLQLRPAYAVVQELFGEERARALFVDNPSAAFEGRDLPYVPDQSEKANPQRRKRFIFF